VGNELRAAATVLAAVTAAVLARDLVTGEQLTEPALIDLVACGGVVLLGLVAGAVALGRSRYSGTLPPALVGWGLVVFSTLAAGVDGVADQLVTLPDGVAGAAGLAGRSVAFVLFAAAVLLPAVDTRVRPWLLAALVLSGSAGLFGGLLVMAGQLGAGSHLSPAWGLLLAVVWFALAALYLARGARSWTFAWCALGFAGLGGGRVVQAVLEPDGGHLPGALAIQLVGMACVLYGITRDLQLDLVRSRVEVERIRAAEEDAEEQIRQLASERHHLAHEVRNALQAIGGATSTLERYRDRLDPATVTALSEGVAREVQRLQGLFDVPAGDARDGLSQSSSGRS
jgi:signal transduction histidine kinase